MNIHAYWQAVLSQNAAAMREFLSPSAVIRWPNTNEEFTSEEFIRANCEYPGHWAGEVLRTETVRDLVITAVHVSAAWDPAVSFHVVSFIQLDGGRIAAMDEYWGDDGPPPQWRRELGLGKKIREV
jgi:hypothetical protein